MGLREGFLRGSFSVDPNQAPVRISSLFVPQSRHIFQFTQASGDGAQRSLLQIFKSGNQGHGSYAFRTLKLSKPRKNNSFR
jgi:hypothetical protein